MTKSTQILAECSLAHRTAQNCAWCGGELPKRRRTWCSNRCADGFWKNHWWSLARRAAKRRDKYRCARCGHVPVKRPTKRSVSTTAYNAAMRAWRKTRKGDRLEVNHRIPCMGLHRTLSCAHHLENLETLCVACHREHTGAIRKRAKAATSASE